LGKDILILGIETSCDETAASIVKNGREVLSNVILSQIEIHEKYGGVVPEIASRNHIYDISGVVDESLAQANAEFDDIDGIAVTYGPGLVGALLVGLSYAKGLSFAINKPLIGVNHIEGHIFANFIEYPHLEPPLISLVVSGGHTHLVYMEDYSTFQILGHTKDDAAGEAYDKVARVLGLGYPGGPKLEALAKEGNPHALDFPRAMIFENNLDFSFSGLKSAVINYLNKMKMMGWSLPNPNTADLEAARPCVLSQTINSADVAASFQQAVCEVIVEKSIVACKVNSVEKLAFCGGVACNSFLRDSLLHAAKQNNIEFYVPSKILCTDNAAMIAARGYYSFLEGSTQGLFLNATPGLKIGEKNHGHSFIL